MFRVNCGNLAQNYPSVHVLVLAFLVGFLPSLSAHAGVTQVMVVVDENNTDWGFAVESGTPTSGYAVGPATPPLGAGSAGFQLTATSDGVILGTLLHAGQRLAQITQLRYSTYQSASPQAPSLQLNVDYDNTDGTTSWQGRLVYEPHFTQTVLTDTWQGWNTRTAAGTGNWWSTGTPIVGDSPSAALCVIGNPCTWSELLTAYPNAAIHLGALGGLLFKAGSGWPAGYSASVDELILEDGLTETTYDFETVFPVELQSFSVE